MGFFDNPDSLRKLGILGGGALLAATGNPLGLLIPNLYASALERGQRRDQMNAAAQALTSPQYVYDPSGAVLDTSTMSGPQFDQGYLRNLPQASMQQRMRLPAVQNAVMGAIPPETLLGEAAKQMFSTPEPAATFNVIDTQSQNARPFAVTEAGFSQLTSRMPGRYARAPEYTQPRAEGEDETWNNPVPEIGPDGSPIQVRYSNRGNRQVVENAVPARQGNPFDRPDYWRQQFKPYLDSAQNAVVQNRKVKQAKNLGTGAGDIAMINAVQKQIDEGAVVRDQDVELIQGAQSLIGRFLNAQGQVLEGTVLTPDLRNQLEAVSDAMTRAIQMGVEGRISPYVPTMQSEGVSIDSIVPAQVRDFYGWAPSGVDSALWAEMTDQERALWRTQH